MRLKTILVIQDFHCGVKTVTWVSVVIISSLKISKNSSTIHLLYLQTYVHKYRNGQLSRMLGIPKAKLRPQNKTINPELSYLDRNGPFFYVLLSHE